MREIQAIAADVTTVLQPLLEEAFQAGKAAGREEAEQELRTFKAKIAAMIGGDAQASIANVIQPGTPSGSNQRDVEDGRATPGTVKPTILRMLKNSERGLTTKQLTEKTGFKPNSVRGTLWTLKNENAIKQVEGRWTYVNQDGSLLRELALAGNDRGGGDDEN